MEFWKPEAVAVLDEEVADAVADPRLVGAVRRHQLEAVDDHGDPEASGDVPLHRGHHLGGKRMCLADERAHATGHVAAQLRAKRLVLAQQILHAHRAPEEGERGARKLQPLEDLAQPFAHARLVPARRQTARTGRLRGQTPDDRQEEVGDLDGRRDAVVADVVDHDAHDAHDVVLVPERLLEAGELRGLPDADASGEPERDRGVAPSDLLQQRSDGVAGAAGQVGPEHVDQPVAAHEPGRVPLLRAQSAHAVQTLAQRIEPLSIAHRASVAPGPTKCVRASRGASSPHAPRVLHGGPARGRRRPRLYSRPCSAGSSPRW